MELNGNENWREMLFELRFILNERINSDEVHNLIINYNFILISFFINITDNFFEIH